MDFHSAQVKRWPWNLALLSTLSGSRYGLQKAHCRIGHFQSFKLIIERGYPQGFQINGMLTSKNTFVCMCNFLWAQRKIWILFEKCPTCNKWGFQNPFLKATRTTNFLKPSSNPLWNLLRSPCIQATTSRKSYKMNWYSSSTVGQTQSTLPSLETWECFKCMKCLYLWNHKGQRWH